MLERVVQQSLRALNGVAEDYHSSDTIFPFICALVAKATRYNVTGNLTTMKWMLPESVAEIWDRCQSGLRLFNL